MVLGCESACVVLGCMNLRVVAHLEFWLLAAKVYYKDYIQILRVTFFILKKFLVVKYRIIIELLVLIYHLAWIVMCLLLLLLRYYHDIHYNAYFIADDCIVALINERFHCFHQLHSLKLASYP